MKYMMAVLALCALLSGCADKRTTCYGIEPDGDVETLRPCPNGWQDKSTHLIKEDEYKHLEQDAKDKSRKKTTPKKGL